MSTQKGVCVDCCCFSFFFFLSSSVLTYSNLFFFFIFFPKKNKSFLKGHYGKNALTHGMVCGHQKFSDFQKCVDAGVIPTPIEELREQMKHIPSCLSYTKQGEKPDESGAAAVRDAVKDAVKEEDEEEGVVAVDDDADSKVIFLYCSIPSSSFSFSLFFFCLLLNSFDPDIFRIYFFLHFFSKKK